MVFEIGCYMNNLQKSCYTNAYVSIIGCSWILHGQKNYKTHKLCGQCGQ